MKTKQLLNVIYFSCVLVWKIKPQFYCVRWIIKFRLLLKCPQNKTACCLIEITVEISENSPTWQEKLMEAEPVLHKILTNDYWFLPIPKLSLTAQAGRICLLHIAALFNSFLSSFCDISASRPSLVLLTSVGCLEIITCGWRLHSLYLQNTFNKTVTK